MKKIILISLVVCLLSPIYIVIASSTHRSQLATTPGIRESYKIMPIAGQQDGVTTQAVGSATAEQLAAAMDIAPADLVSASIGTSDSGGVGVSTGDLGNYMPTKGTLSLFWQPVWQQRQKLKTIAAVQVEPWVVSITNREMIWYN